MFRTDEGKLVGDWGGEVGRVQLVEGQAHVEYLALIVDITIITIFLRTEKG